MRQLIALNHSRGCDFPPQRRRFAWRCSGPGTRASNARRRPIAVSEADPSSSLFSRQGDVVVRRGKGSNRHTRSFAERNRRKVLPSLFLELNALTCARPKKNLPPVCAIQPAENRGFRRGLPVKSKSPSTVPRCWEMTHEPSHPCPSREPKVIAPGSMSSRIQDGFHIRAW